MNDIEVELKKRFAELRADDESHAPAFAAVRERDAFSGEPKGVVHRRRRLAGSLLLLAAAAVVVAAVWGVAQARNDRARRAAWLRDSTAMAVRWTMPTDGLLESARRTLQTPALSASVLDATAAPIPGTPFKGN